MNQRRLWVGSRRRRLARRILRRELFKQQQFRNIVRIGAPIRDHGIDPIGFALYFQDKPVGYAPAPIPKGVAEYLYVKIIPRNTFT